MAHRQSLDEKLKEEEPNNIEERILNEDHI